MSEKKEERKQTPPPTDPRVMPTAMQAHENMEKVPTTDLKRRKL